LFNCDCKGTAFFGTTNYFGSFFSKKMHFFLHCFLMKSLNGWKTAFCGFWDFCGFGVDLV